MANWKCANLCLVLPSCRLVDHYLQQQQQQHHHQHDDTHSYSPFVCRLINWLLATIVARQEEDNFLTARGAANTICIFANCLEGEGENEMVWKCVQRRAVEAIHCRNRFNCSFLSSTVESAHSAVSYCVCVPVSYYSIIGQNSRKKGEIKQQLVTKLMSIDDDRTWFAVVGHRQSSLARVWWRIVWGFDLK